MVLVLDRCGGGGCRCIHGRGGRIGQLLGNPFIQVVLLLLSLLFQGGGGGGGVWVACGCRRA